MSTTDSYLKALLALSGNSQFAGARHALLKTLNDEDLLNLVKEIMDREFARGSLEDIASVVLDVVVDYSGDTVSPTTPDTPSASQAATYVAQPRLDLAVPVVAVSLRCQTEQIIADMTVPSIQCVRWNKVLSDYVDFHLARTKVQRIRVWQTDLTRTTYLPNLTSKIGATS